MKKEKPLKIFYVDVQATVRYKVLAIDEIEAKVKIMDGAGYEPDLKGEIIYDEKDLQQATVELA